MSGPASSGPGRPRVLLATHNRKKLDELARILVPLVPGVEVLGLDDVGGYDEPAETEPTFAGNATLKAKAAVGHAGLPSIGDDSGLCVDALNGMPGILSARWAGRAKDYQANNDLLLEQLTDVPDERRGAAFVTVLALALPDGEVRLVEGRLPGRIIRQLRGEGGFGYDPIFVPDGGSQTLAEMPAAAKDAISHRGRALRELAPLVAEVLRAA